MPFPWEQRKNPRKVTAPRLTPEEHKARREALLKRLGEGSERSTGTGWVKAAEKDTWNSGKDKARNAKIGTRFTWKSYRDAKHANNKAENRGTGRKRDKADKRVGFTERHFVFTFLLSSLLFFEFFHIWVLLVDTANIAYSYGKDNKFRY